MQRSIAYDLYGPVRHRHHKSRCSQRRNLLYQFFIQTHGITVQFQNCLFPRQKTHYPKGRKPLGYHSCNGGSPDTHLEYKDQNRIQNNICNRPQSNCQHPDLTKPLCIDEIVHPQADHYKQSSAQINGNISICIGKCNFTCTKQIQQRLFKQQAPSH